MSQQTSRTACLHLFRPPSKHTGAQHQGDQALHLDSLNVLLKTPSIHMVCALWGLCNVFSFKDSPSVKKHFPCSCSVHQLTEVSCCIIDIHISSMFCMWVWEDSGVVFEQTVCIPCVNSSFAACQCFPVFSLSRFNKARIS